MQLFNVLCMLFIGTSTTVGSNPASAQINCESNGLMGSYEKASQLASAPTFMPRNFQNREFIGG